jgi:3-oxoacyl-[acyl-carrier protein] reductase
MINQRFGRIVNITSGSVKNPIPHLGLSNGARAGLTGFVAGLARQVAQHNVTINGLLPGQFNTDRITSLFEAKAKKTICQRRMSVPKRRLPIPCRRLGETNEFGQACAFLCGRILDIW